MSQHPPSIDNLLHTLQSSHSLHVRPTYLQPLLASLLASPRAPATPAVLLATIRSRVLASDIKLSLQSFAHVCLPPSLPGSGANLTLPQEPVVVQVLDVADMSMSRLETLEKAEMRARGEVARGKVIIRVLPEERGADDGAGDSEQKEGGWAKVLVEDAAGRRVWAIEADRVPGLRTVQIGGKVLLKGTEVARGVLLLRAATCTVLGSKIEAWHKKWTEGRLDRLQKQVEALRASRERGRGDVER